jgi:hypothetical protein
MKAMYIRRLFAGMATTTLLLAAALGLRAQSPTGPQSGSQPPQNAPTEQKPAAQAPPQAGVTIAVEAPIVTVDAVATTKNGDLLMGLKKENFKITDDGVPQTITGFNAGEAPITMVVLLEFSSRAYGFFAAYAKYWADALFPNLQQKDWVALETFDMKTRLEVDFTQDKNEVRNAIYHLYFPGFSESNVFDALLETNERLRDVKGKKSILLLASGIDTFSKHTLDQTMKQLRQNVYKCAGDPWITTLGNRLSASGERVADILDGDRRFCLVSAIRWRDSRDFSAGGELFAASV